VAPDSSNAVLRARPRPRAPPVIRMMWFFRENSGRMEDAEPALLLSGLRWWAVVAKRRVGLKGTEVGGDWRCNGWSMGGGMARGRVRGLRRRIGRTMVGK